ncbi:MAG: CapA family protein [Eubacteriales bacterium]|nr:CapA family protein [Eubacteriales bacterium]
MKYGKGLLCALLALLISAGSALADTQIVMTFVGDCTVGCEDRLLGKDYSFAGVAEREGYGYFLAKVKDFFAEDDLTVGNFEGVLKDTHYGAANKTYCFRGLADYAQILTLGSVEAVNLANNHTGDYGTTGRSTTLKALKAAGINTFDETSEYVFEKDGIKIAFCGFWGVGFNKRADITARIRQLKEEGANAVVCALHFGEEYATYHNKVQTQVARMVIEAGADVVVGHHPHVVQGMEVYDSRTIFYSVGNFLFGGNAEVRSNECLVPRVTLTFGDDGTYLGQQVQLYPANESGNAEMNDYQPRLVQGKAAEAVFAKLDADSEAMTYQQTNACRVYPYLAAGMDEEEP